MVSGGLKYDPYGAEFTVTANDRDKFGTYYRDSNTGFNYADQRYYGSSGGRFLTPDPYLRSARASDPQTWNRYSYVAGDPVNRNDPSGLIPEVPGLLAPPNLSVGIGSAIDAWGLPWWMPFPLPSIGSPQTAPTPEDFQRLFSIFDSLAGAGVIDGWSYADGSGTNFSLAVSRDVFGWMTSSGTAVMTQPGVYVIGGVLIRVVVTAAGALTSPVVLTVTGVAATAAVAYWIYMAGQDLRQVQATGRQIARERGCRQPTKDDQERVHEILKDQKGTDGKVSWDELLEASREVLCK